MYYIYVLKSLKSGKRYVGMTSQELSKRIAGHNQGATTWTRAHRPLELIYSENSDSKSIARIREKFLKTGQGSRFLDRILKKA